MIAPLPAVYPPATLLYYCDHPWPVPAPCQQGIWVPCATCGVNYAPCTRSEIDRERVADRTWRCQACEGGESCPA
jgi:hypothetical protein